MPDSGPKSRETALTPRKASSPNAREKPAPTWTRAPPRKWLANFSGKGGWLLYGEGGSTGTLPSTARAVTAAGMVGPVTVRNDSAPRGASGALPAGTSPAWNPGGGSRVGDAVSYPTKTPSVVGRASLGRLPHLFGQPVHRRRANPHSVAPSPPSRAPDAERATPAPGRAPARNLGSHGSRRSTRRGHHGSVLGPISEDEAVEDWGRREPEALSSRGSAPSLPTRPPRSHVTQGCPSASP